MEAYLLRLFHLPRKCRTPRRMCLAAHEPDYLAVAAVREEPIARYPPLIIGLNPPPLSVTVTESGEADTLSPVGFHDGEASKILKPIRVETRGIEN